jgi:hypothetical protein
MEASREGDRKAVEAKADEARREAQTYCAEALARFEVVSMRYVVRVSNGRLAQLPDPGVEGGVAYAHVNVVVNPEMHSKSARKPQSG